MRSRGFWGWWVIHSPIVFYPFAYQLFIRLSVIHSPVVLLRLRLRLAMLTAPSPLFGAFVIGRPNDLRRRLLRDQRGVRQPGRVLDPAPEHPLREGEP